VIVFASDFGHADGYVGVVEAVIAKLAPSERVIHLAHDVAPQDVRAASLVLCSAAPHLPNGAVVLAVIDPGVGGSRRAIAARGERLVVVGPDNGLFGALWTLDPPIEARALHRDPAIVARTFDGRDVFAPAAAHLAAGASLDQLGESIELATLAAGSVLPTRGPSGEIWTFDRFGNAITNLLGSAHRVEIGAHTLAVRTHYADVAIGEAVAYRGSSGLVEIAVRDGSARDQLGLRASMPVRVVD
jgi:S-adenosylmethionine hydrolase